MPVLVVDDDPVNLKLLSYMLGALDAAPVVEFADPREALAWCAAQESRALPGLALVDQLMPGLSGLEFVERLRDLPQGRDIPVLMISADVNEDLRGRGERLGVAGFLAKPVAKAELLQMAQQLMRR